MSDDIRAFEEDTLARPDGTVLKTYAMEPESTPRALIQICHGMAEHAGRYARFATTLTHAGFSVIAHDHRGHGGTKGPDSTLGHFGPAGSFQKVIDDVLAVGEMAAVESKPTFILGHSMGSIITFNTILKQPETYAGAALWNSGVETGALATLFGGILKTQRFFLGSDVPSSLARKLTFEAWNKEFAPNRSDFDWLSRDEAEVDAYVNDPLCGFPVTIGLWLEVLSGIHHAANDKNLAKLPTHMPIHLLAGGEDPCTERGKAMENIEQRMKARSMGNVSLSLLENTRHESLNELNRDATTQNFIHWLNQNISQ